MKKNSALDYISCILFRLCSPVIRRLPLGFSFFLGRIIGDLFYHFDFRHRLIVYSNIRTAFCDKLTPQESDSLTKKFYRAFGQNLIEIFLIPLIGQKYINKYITFEGLEYISEAFKNQKGIIFLGMHEGSWELSNIISANLKIPYNLLVRQQRLPRLNRLLNIYRRQKGCKIIQRENQTRQIIQVLKDNEAIGMSTDQGGKTGMQVKFFGKNASMSSGPVRLALKYGTVILPVFWTRIKGPYIKIIISPPLKIKRTGDLEKDLRDNLGNLMRIFEKYIAQYPYEYLWSYKLWKYSDEKKILILNDGKTGHLRQAQATAKITAAYLNAKGINSSIDIQEARFKNKFSRYALILNVYLAGKYGYQRQIRCIRRFLDDNTYDSLIRLKPDIIISAGSAVSPLNFLLSRLHLAKSITIMRPSFLSTKYFDLVIMPKHDAPPSRKNVIVTDGALNLIDEDYLKDQVDKLTQATRIPQPASRLYIGLLIGGDTKDFKLSPDLMKDVINQIKTSLDKFDAEILVSSSRRTPLKIEQLLKEEFKDYPRCNLLIIANEKNMPSALGAILGLSQIVITSPESISMISEAANSKKYVLVFNGSGLGSRHKRFLDYFTAHKYIYLAEPDNLTKAIENIWSHKPAIRTPSDHFIVSEAIKNIL